MRLARGSNSQYTILGLNLLLLPCRGRAFLAPLGFPPFPGVALVPSPSGVLLLSLPFCGLLGFSSLGPLCFPPFGGLLGRFPVLIKILMPSGFGHVAREVVSRKTQVPA